MTLEEAKQWLGTSWVLHSEYRPEDNPKHSDRVVLLYDWVPICCDVRETFKRVRGRGEQPAIEQSVSVVESSFSMAVAERKRELLAWFQEHRDGRDQSGDALPVVRDRLQEVAANGQAQIPPQVPARPVVRERPSVVRLARQSSDVPEVLGSIEGNELKALWNKQA
jgi:hypothetical protein